MNSDHSFHYRSCSQRAWTAIESMKLVLLDTANSSVFSRNKDINLVITCKSCILLIRMTFHCYVQAWWIRKYNMHLLAGRTKWCEFLACHALENQIAGWVHDKWWSWGSKWSGVRTLLRKVRSITVADCWKQSKKHSSSLVQTGTYLWCLTKPGTILLPMNKASMSP